MNTKYGPSVNGVKLGFQYEGFEFSKDGKKARITKPRVVIYRDVNLKDNSNLLLVSGTVILKQKDQKVNKYPNTNCSGRGRKILKRLTGEWVTLDETKTINKLFSVELHKIDQSAQPLRVTGYISFPAARV